MFCLFLYSFSLTPTHSLTYANATLMCVQMDAAIKAAMESVTHDSEVYARQRQDLVIAM